MDRPLRLLIVDDCQDDADLLVAAVCRAGFAVSHAVVDTTPAMRAELQRQDWDVITSDYSMPQFGAPAAMALAKELCPRVPFIVVSGEADPERALSLMNDGARDCIQKRELPRLIPAIEHALRDVRDMQVLSVRRRRAQGPGDFGKPAPTLA